MNRSSPWRELALLALWLVATIGWRPLTLPDEGRYAGVAFEMLHGSWLEPTLDGLPYFHKPPLLYWAVMGCYELFGVHDWSARLFPALTAWLTALVVYGWGRKVGGRVVGRRSSTPSGAPGGIVREVESFMPDRSGMAGRALGDRLGLDQLVGARQTLRNAVLAGAVASTVAMGFMP